MAAVASKRNGADGLTRQLGGKSYLKYSRATCVTTRLALTLTVPWYSILDLVPPQRALRPDKQDKNRTQRDRSQPSFPRNVPYDFNLVYAYKEAACKEAGLSFPTAKTYGLICAVFPNGDRHQHLSFWHHQQLMVQDLSDYQRRELLEKARENGWSAATGDSDSEINVKVLLQNCQRVIAERRGF